MLLIDISPFKLLVASWTLVYNKSYGVHFSKVPGHFIPQHFEVAHIANGLIAFSRFTPKSS